MLAPNKEAVAKVKDACDLDDKGRVIVKPQAGQQHQLLACSADIAIYGGGAGAGKTMGLLLDPLHYIHVKGFRGVIFRRTYPDITNPGSLRDEAMQLYPDSGAVAKDDAMRWVWPESGAWLKFSHMQYDSDAVRWKGAQLAFAGFDELPDFSKFQFFYMLSRMRSMCGVNPYIRATCNPVPDSWVHELIKWWLDEDGYPIKKRSGVIRWIAIDGMQVHWGDSKKELEKKGLDPLSFTFIPALLSDNPILTNTDPSYARKLKNLPHYERMTLLGGCWNVRLVAGVIFNEEWFDVVDEAPPYDWDPIKKDRDGAPITPPCKIIRVLRYWDRAASEPSPSYPDPDWTVGVKLGLTDDSNIIVLDVVRERLRPRGVRAMIRATAKADGEYCEQWLEEDPGQAGKQDIDALTTLLSGYIVRVNRVETAKAIRARTASAQAESGHIHVLRGDWNGDFLRELNGFMDTKRTTDGSKRIKPPPGYHDDQVDGFTGGVNQLFETIEAHVSRL